MELFNFKDIRPFIEPATIFKKYGYYTNAPVDTLEYNRYWDEQERRCLEGYTVDGIRVTGDHYFYLNFSRMDKHDGNDSSKTSNKIEDFPDFWDGDYIYYHVLDIAKNGISDEAYNKLKLPFAIKEKDRLGGKHLAILKTRRRGYSFKNASLATKYYSLIRKSNTYVTAYQKELYAVIISMISQDLNFINEYTGFGRTRDYVNKLTLDGFHVEASYKRTLPDGKEVKKGYLSQIKALTLRDNPDALRGKSANLILFEEAGSNPLLKATWLITMPGLEAGKYTTGTMVAFGTGGDVSGGLDFMDMFYNPEPYNLISLQNIWDEGKDNTFVSLFVPDYLNKEGFIDANGNSDVENARIHEQSKRDEIKRTSNDATTVDKRVTEYPFTCAEAMLSVNVNKFPVRDLSSLLARIETNKKYFDAEFNGYFVLNEAGFPEFKLDSKIPIRNFPPKKNEDITGTITIWEHPYTTEDEKIPYGMYVAGIDPVALEEAPTSDSVNAVYVYNTITNRIVAEYCGRTNNTNDFYEQTRRLIKYYNAILLYENMVTGILSYFDSKNETYLLADPPSILANLIKDSSVKRKKGCHMTSAVKAHGIDLINNWLRDDDNQEGVSNLYSLRSPALLKELIHYNSNDNFDRCFIPGTNIATSNGNVKIENIEKYNSLVLTHTGTYEIIEEVMKNNYNGELISITPHGQPFPLVTTPMHPHLISSNKKIANRRKYKEQRRILLDKEWKCAKDISKDRDFLLIPKRKELDTHTLTFEQLYVLGWYLGDGYINKQGKLKITFQGDQLHLAENVKKAILTFESFDQHYNTKGIKIEKIKDKFAYDLTCTSRNFNSLLKEYITIKPGGEKSINELLFACNNLLPLVVGFLEADGSQKQTKLGNSIRDTIEVSGVYQILISQIRQILLDNDIWSTCNIVKEKFNKIGCNGLVMNHCKEQLRLDIQDKKGINKIANLSKKFSNVAEIPQKEFFIKTEDGWWIPIKKIETVLYNGPVYNLEVETKHSYVANNIATHNCMGLMMTLIQADEMRKSKDDPYEKQQLSNKNKSFFSKRIFSKRNNGIIRMGNINQMIERV